jgi:hypothetical protein
LLAHTSQVIEVSRCERPLTRRQTTPICRARASLPETVCAARFAATKAIFDHAGSEASRSRDREKDRSLLVQTTLMSCSNMCSKRQSLVANQSHDNDQNDAAREILSFYCASDLFIALFEQHRTLQLIEAMRERDPVTVSIEKGRGRMFASTCN